MKTPYSKPKTLSDPYIDWQDSEAELARVVAANPEDLGREDYGMIFYQNLPAANYMEGCFYVPFFLDFYARGWGFKSPNLEGFFWFVDHHRNEFERDGLLQPILERIWEIFLGRTATFSIHRLTDEEIALHRICESYRELALGAQAVNELLDCFTTWDVYRPLTERLKEHFAAVTTEVKSFWYCECAFHTRTWLWVDSQPEERRQDLFDFFHRLSRFSAHYGNSLMNSDINKGFFQYNRRLSPT